MIPFLPFDAEGFRGTERFRVERRLGSGAFGVVYEAWDNTEQRPVAIKVLRVAEADALYRFKTSFRALADIRHPNLAAFYELLEADGLWFLTMELVQGLDFLEHMRGKPWQEPIGSSITSTVVQRPAELEPPLDEASAKLPASPPLASYGQIRGALVQLARGLHALHKQGRLHRDIKPSNLLVTPEGRVVVLDFGLVAELAGREPTGSSLSSHLVGTPIYMAPEQALGLPPSPANDWYSVGVLLFQTLTGQLPFSGSLVAVLSRKQVEDPPDVRQLVPGVPEDLARLTQDLLIRDTSARATGPDILSRLDGRPVEPSPDASPVSAESAFVGRRGAMAALNEAFADSHGGAVAIFIRGASGIGKSALVEHFLDRLGGTDSKAVVLSGRCYPQESVPYKAFDSLIDSLSRYLVHLPQREAEVVLPVHAAALARLFPVLRRVPAVAEARGRVIHSSDQQALRRRAFTALRDLLTRLAERRDLVLAIDDLHWGDVDSFELLTEILAPPDPPSLLLVGSYRSEDQDTNPFLRAFAEHREGLIERGLDVRDLELGALSARDAHALIANLTSNHAAVTAKRAEALVDEAGGSPLFLTELARSAHLTASAPPGQDAPSAAGNPLHAVLEARISELTPQARGLLAIIAVAGRPLAADVACQAADLEPDHPDRGDILTQLLNARLLRRPGGDGPPAVVSYHDRIRETAVAALDADALRHCHQRLAEVLEEVGDTDPEALAAHFRSAGQSSRAYAYALAAAEQADGTLAFARAADLYRMALELHRPEHGERFLLEARQAAALAHAGRSYDAAEAYLEAVGHSGAVDPFDLQRAAAEKLLVSGHIDRGLAVLRHVLRTVDLELQTARWKTLWRLRWHRLLLRLRGWQIEERPELECDPAMLRRIDVCWSGEVGLCLVDLLYASGLHARQLLWALEAGEPRRVGRGLAMEIFFGALEGQETLDSEAAARRLAGRLGDAECLGLIDMACGMRACLEGQWERSHRELTGVEERLREPRPGVAVDWELDTVLCFRSLAALQMGRWDELFTELPGLLDTARDHGDLYLEVHLRQWVESLRELAADAPERAAAAVGQTIERWSQQGFHFQHFGHLDAAVRIALYQGDGEAAWQRVREAWPRLVRSQIRRMTLVRVQAHDLRARASLAAACNAQDDEVGRRKRRLRRAEREARRLSKEEGDWPRGLAALLRAGLAAARGHFDAVHEPLEEASTSFEAASMVVHAAVARRRLAQHLGDSAGVAASDRILRAQGVRRPTRMAAVLAPGFPG